MADNETAPILNGEQSASYNGEGNFDNDYERLSKERNYSYIESISVSEVKVRQFTLGFVAIIAVIVFLTVILSIVQCAKNGAAYLLLGINIICIGSIELALIYAVRYRNVLPDKNWFLYLVGFIVFTEAIFTNVLLYNS